MKLSLALLCSGVGAAEGAVDGAVLALGCGLEVSGGGSADFVLQAERTKVPDKSKLSTTFNFFDMLQPPLNG
ncbi:hypothetical protein ACTHRH_17815 [Paenibacillus sp. SAFN-117]|uniref:hypothetical protein n=1 Tax=Paenibacillus sp. 32O-W TaxID=1695218 RepID=UPI0021B67D81|nr:hypothetical protein [Paenibacillus sp. 32O-W]